MFDVPNGMSCKNDLVMLKFIPNLRHLHIWDACASVAWAEIHWVVMPCSYRCCTHTGRSYHAMGKFLYESVAKGNEHTNKMQKWNRIIQKKLTNLSSERNLWVISNGHVSNWISGCCFAHFTRWVWIRLFKITWHLLYGQMTVSS